MDARRIDRDWELEEMRANLRNWDIRDIITILGESDVLEVMGVKRCLEFVQAVGLGPASEDRRFVRRQVKFMASGYECLERD